MKALLITTVGVLIAAALLMTFGIPASFLIGTLEARVEHDSGYHLQIKGAHVRFWPSVMVSLDDISLVDRDEPRLRSRFKAASARAALSFADLLHGRTRITRLTIFHPILRVPLRPQRRANGVVPATPPGAAGTGRKDTLTMERIVIDDGAIGFFDGSDHLVSSIDRINLDASLSSAAGRQDAIGSLYWGGQLLQFEVKSQKWLQGLEGQIVPVVFTLQAPGLLADKLSASTELSERNRVLDFDAIAGRIGQAGFDGSVVLHLERDKPLLKGKLNFDRLQILSGATAGTGTHPLSPTRQNALTEPWSDREIRFDGLNFLDADLTASANELDVDTFRFTSIAAAASLKDGVLEVALGHAGLYGGEANGTFSLDASGNVPTQAMQVRLNGVKALPLLSDVADFQSLEGTMQANIDVRAAGSSERSALSSLNGTVDIHLSDGAMRGIDLAKMMHNLTSTILNGWQQNASDKTPLTDFSAHFRLADGIATTDDLALSGPVVRMTGSGTIEIPAKTLQVKVDPELVMADQGSDKSDQAGGLGVPVMIQGNWSAPRIYPDVAGILDNPDSIYNQLRAAGKGLFGEAGRSSSNGTIKGLMQGLGNMLHAPADTGGGSSGNAR